MLRAKTFFIITVALAALLVGAPWSAAQEPVQLGDWKFDILATGVNTTFQGAAGINYPVEDLETGWGVCFRYVGPDGTILRRKEGGDWNCALLTDYEALIIDRAAGTVTNWGGLLVSMWSKVTPGWGSRSIRNSSV